MKAYPVTENEIGMLDHYSAQKTIFFSFSTFFLGLACEIQLHASFSHEAPTPAAILLSTYGIWILIVLAAFFAIAGGMAMWRAGKTWDRIKGEAISQ